MEFKSRRSTVRARNGMVATNQPLAAMAGLRMLLEGGNAVDAAVATASTLNVVDPGSTGVGGDVFALVWMAKDKKVHALNASGRSPGASSLAKLRSLGLDVVPPESAHAVTVPGAVSGWEAILQTYGTMPLSKVLEPAINYASNGYPVSEVISAQWEANVHKLRAGPAGTELMINGRAPKSGETIRLPELAGTLQTIAEGGAEAFYKGPLARKIAEFVQHQGGCLSEEDFNTHSITWEEALCVEYRGVHCWQCPPNTQGVSTLSALNLAEGFEIKKMGFQSADTYHHLIECFRLALADSLGNVTDPDSMRVSPAQLISKTYAQQRRKLIRPDRAMPLAAPGLPQTPGDTVYLSAVDGQGNACSFINSLFMGFGSGLVVPGTGIALQNRGASFSLDPSHPNALAPNKRPFHTLIPGMATRGGELWLSYGVMGGMQQAQGHFQVLVNKIDFGLDPQASLDAPRFSVRAGEGTAIEKLVPKNIVDELEKRGHELISPEGIFFGGGQMIERDPESGVLSGGSEPRLDGFAAGW